MFVNRTTFSLVYIVVLFIHGKHLIQVNLELHVNFASNGHFPIYTPKKVHSRGYIKYGKRDVNI